MSKYFVKIFYWRAGSTQDQRPLKFAQKCQVTTMPPHIMLYVRQPVVILTWNRYLYVPTYNEYKI